MAVVVQQEGPVRVCRIDGDLTFSEVTEIAEALRSVLIDHRSTPVHLDLGGIADFDLSGVQLLYAWCHAVAERGVLLHVEAGPFGARAARMTSFAGLPPLSCLSSSFTRDVDHGDEDGSHE